MMPSQPALPLVRRSTRHRIVSQSFFNGASQTEARADASLDPWWVAVDAGSNQKTAAIRGLLENAKVGFDNRVLVRASEKFNRAGAGPLKGPWAKPA